MHVHALIKNEVDIALKAVGGNDLCMCIICVPWYLNIVLLKNRSF